MNIAIATGEAAERAGCIALVALAIAPRLARWLALATKHARSWPWALLLAPMLTPALLVSYAYAPCALRLGGFPLALGALYCSALAFKLVPLAALVFHFLPPALSADAAHCHALLGGSRWRRWMFRIHGAGRAPWIAGGLVFLLAFADFELASLWSVKTWTVTLFDAQTGGLALGESLRLAASPFAIEVLAVALILRQSGVGGTAPRVALGRHRAAVAYLWFAAAAITVLPALCIAIQAATGLRSVWDNFALARETLVSLGFGLGAALLAWPLAQWIAGRRGLALIACGPGLLGALLLSLFVLTAFQSRWLRPLYDTPVPLLGALTLLSLPLAVPLAWLLAGAQRDPALHVARLAGAREIVWQLETRRRWLAAFLLFCAAYFDLTAGSILAPLGLTPVFARLHNLAHYGQTAVLSAMLLAALAIPFLLLLCGSLAARLRCFRG